MHPAILSIVQEQKYLDAAGNDMFVDNKFSSKYLDLGNILLDGNTGDITLTGNINFQNGNINWSTINSDPKIQEATDDINALARGQYTKAGTAFINKNFIYSPNIQAGKFYGSYLYSTQEKTYLQMMDEYYGIGGAGAGITIFAKQYYNGDYVDPAIAAITRFWDSTEWSSWNHKFLKTNPSTAYPVVEWDFSGAKVTGITYTFA